MSQSDPAPTARSVETLKWPSYVGLALAMGWPFAFLALGHAGVAHLADRSLDVNVLIREWSVSAVLVAIIVFGERLTLASVGLKMPRLADVAYLFLAIVVTFIGNGIAFAIGAALSGGAASPPAALASLLSIPLVLRVAMALTAGICEEFMSRGYAIERLTAITGNRFIGAAVPCILFTLGHIRLYGFGVGLLPVLASAIVMTILYVWRRNLVVNMAAHALIDLYGLLVQPLHNH
jgi:membrane protease YdiL (CAAX protease family)